MLDRNDSSPSSAEKAIKVLTHLGKWLVTYIDTNVTYQVLIAVLHIRNVLFRIWVQLFLPLWILIQLQILFRPGPNLKKNNILFLSKIFQFNSKNN
jgi:hypothetical protein